ncbi:hypothetical protein PV10_01699 [Exophiala mesophila]|uniref:Mediator of RNA polymerase II transcription subunit 21 n=1 Tax=Exophiala mesophila TaxID=212818 RepID=A0A0D1X800_EXOME|nr:uncharacterized protein PV10_01699 [Exophiala mesophila]KIV98005.1 hypothetical protein PV10_01699 [Exophiala mesophila]
MSNDILTQLQTCYDQLLTQLFSTLSYLSQRHPLIHPIPDPNDPYTNPPTQDGHDNTNTIAPGLEDTDRAPYPLRPVAPSTFENAQQELAEDLVLKTQQIELLIARLPGIGLGENQQREEIEKLSVKVREMEERRKAKRKEMREYVKKLDDVVLGMAKSIEYSPKEANGVNGHDKG